MEGKSPAQIQTKVQTVRERALPPEPRIQRPAYTWQVWWPTYSKAICVFAPTQIFNFTLVPSHLRMLMLQSVGLCERRLMSPWHHSRMGLTCRISFPL